MPLVQRINSVDYGRERTKDRRAVGEPVGIVPSELLRIVDCGLA